MHILVVNDDGPPSPQTSPYVHSFVQVLQGAGHVVSVVLPDTQRSWIGKAHMIGQTVKPTYYRPGTVQKFDGTRHSRPLPAGSSEEEEWILVDGTPASCVQIGLYHYFHDRGPVDLVVSGPNYGRNSTAVFSLNSGTLGGALEAAICKRRSIALSYGFFSRNHDEDIISGASSLSLRLINYLYENWNENVDLYSINVPLIENVGKSKVLWTNILQNYWGHGSCFEEVEDKHGDSDATEEGKIRESEFDCHHSCAPSDEKKVTRHAHKLFKWSPRFTDVRQSVEEAPPGNDGWAVQNGYTSVTPLKANFMNAAAQIEGELKLPTASSLQTKHGSEILINNAKPHLFATVNYQDDYVQPLILDAIKKVLLESSFTLINNVTYLPISTGYFLQIGSYESLPFDHFITHPETSLSNAYVIRKALIRKHYLSNTISNWVTKNPSSILKTNFKPSCNFELDYAEFLDEAIVDAWDLQDSFRRNTGKAIKEREWWILKPGMSDCGQGIRLFSSEEELRNIFEGWEKQQLDSDEDEEDKDSTTSHVETGNEIKDYLVTSHLRHFVSQPYIDPPFLIQDDPRKFHIRTYVLAVGNLKVYVYQDMLALFSGTNYVPPWSCTTRTDLSAHLTNTCLQSGSDDESVKLFSFLPISAALKKSVFAQICDVTGEVFEAAARGMTVHFQTIPNAFEIFGLDFLLDERGTAWLLEVNSFPDFKQTGEALKSVVRDLWEGVMQTAVGGFFRFACQTSSESHSSKMILVRDITMTGDQIEKR